MEIEFNKSYTYKEMCELMGELPCRGGKQRKNQLTKWNKKYTVIKDESKYIFLQESEDCKIKVKPFKYMDCFYLPNELWHIGGIYLIKYDDYVYVGQTQDFKKRLQNHSRGTSYTNILLDNGGIFYLLSIENDLDKRLELEKKYIQQYIDMGFCVINKELNENFQKRNNKQNKVTIKINYDDFKFVQEFLNQNNIKYSFKGKNNGN